MSNFKLQKDEDVVKINSNIKVEANENIFILTLFLTNQRLVLMRDINKELVFNTFLSARLVEIPENLEVALVVDLDIIKEIKYCGRKNIITFKDNDNKLILYCEDITNAI